MNKQNILKYIMGITEYNKEEKELIDSIEQSKIEMDCARSVFENVSDPKLVEVAILAEEAAKKRYEFLLLIAKERGIKVTKEYILDKNLGLVQ